MDGVRPAMDYIKSEFSGEIKFTDWNEEFKNYSKWIDCDTRGVPIFF